FSSVFPSFFLGFASHRYLHSFPTRRSSDLGFSARPLRPAQDEIFRNPSHRYLGAPDAMKSWTRSDVLTAYNIPYWGEGYIDVNDSGEILIRPSRTENGSITLPPLTRQIVSEGSSLPARVRFCVNHHDGVNRSCGA